MILVLVTHVQYECDAIRINLLPHKFADDNSSIENKVQIVRVARQMGSYVATLKNGVVEHLIDPNSILSILTNTMAQSSTNELRK